MKDEKLLRGFSLPLSSPLVETPPWHFGGELIEVVYSTDPKIFASLLPRPFSAVTGETYVSIAMVDMVSTADTQSACDRPDSTNYKECIMKMYCEFQGEKVWYVPAAWVSTDFSLLRGFLMGFGKKIGMIEMTKFHSLHPILSQKKAGVRMSGVSQAFSGIRMTISLELTNHLTSNDKLPFTGLQMCVTRHFPDTEKPGTPLIHDISTLQAKNYQRDNIWNANGNVILQYSEHEPLTAMQPLEIIAARTFSEGFTLLGTKTLYTYGDTR